MTRSQSASSSSSPLVLAAVVLASLALVVSIASYLKAGRTAASLEQAHTTFDIRIDGQTQPEAYTLTDTVTRLPEETIDQAVRMSQVSAPAPTRDAAPAGEPYTVAAGRSPLPQPGENITEPIPANRLQVLEATAEEVPEDKVIPWHEAPEHFGRVVTVEGLIIDTGSTPTIAFLNFDRDRQSFYVVVFSDAWDAAPDGKPDPYFNGKTIQVTGEVSEHRGRPQIRVNDKDQIKVVETE